MKSLSIINWIILSIYVLVLGVAYFKGDGADPAGRAMAQGYMVLFLVFIVVLIGLNLISVKWVKILTLVMGVIPAVYLTIYNFQSQATMDAFEKELRKTQSFDDPHLDLLADAIKNNNAEEVKKLLIQDSRNINLIGSTNKETLLSIAIQNAALFKSEGSFEIIEALIQEGADPNIYHRETGSTMANYAAIIPKELLKLLLEAGADPNSRDMNSEAILYKLMEHGKKKEYGKIELLLKRGADPNIEFRSSKGKGNYAALTYAANRRLWDICGLLIDHGADLNFKSPEGNDFWYYLAEAQSAYEEKEEIPEDYTTLINHPKVVADRN